MNQSLSLRLFISAIVVLCVSLGIAGLVLEKAFTISIDNLVREKLRLHTYTLLSMADHEQGTIKLPATLAEQRFNSADDALLAIVTNEQQQEVWRSISAANKRFALPPPSEGEWLFGRAQDISGDSYYISSYGTVWPDARGNKKTYVFTVMETVDYYRETLAEYRMSIAVALTAFGLILLALQAVILRWGLKPMREVALDVNAMNRGELQSLTGNYPKELQPLTTNLNLLVDNERRQRQRYKDRLADLSHSLKTPLSVLRGVELDIGRDGQPLSRQSVLEALQVQVGRMTEIIDYQLQRAVSAGQHSSFVASSVASEVKGVVNALNKVYIEKNVMTELQVAQGTSFFGDENDITELLGNLLDNAYKHCRQRVRVVASTRDASENETLLQLSIEDDGEGVPEQKRAEILKRGVRLDTTAEGQGFGLAIVVEIIDSYQGTINIASSELGGALFTVTIPTR